MEAGQVVGGPAVGFERALGDIRHHQDVPLLVRGAGRTDTSGIRLRGGGRWDDGGPLGRIIQALEQAYISDESRDLVGMELFPDIVFFLGETGGGRGCDFYHDTLVLLGEGEVGGDGTEDRGVGGMGHVTEEELGLEMGWVLLPGGAIHKILGSCTSVAPVATFGEMSDGVGVHGVGWWCGSYTLLWGIGFGWVLGWGWGLSYTSSGNMLSSSWVGCKRRRVRPGILVLEGWEAPAPAPIR